jgi:hypothetical protein
MGNDEYLTASGAAREIERQLGREVSPREITLLFYYRDIADDQAPIMAGRRMIPRSLLPTVANALLRRGWLRQRREVSA